ncbi:MAG: 3-oxoacyl-[acyl-carrier protein] reductase, partial [Bacteriovoracaceae bacterium]
AEEVSSFANKIKDQNIDSVIFLAAPPFEYIRFKDLEMKRAREEFQIQYFSTIEILKAVTSSMLQKKSGKIILMLSEVVLGDSPAALTHYTSAKYALLGLLNSLSSEYKSKNIQVNALSPGMIDTQFISKLPHKHAEIAAEASKIKRLLNPADITPRILELLKEDKSGLNLETFGE